MTIDEYLLGHWHNRQQAQSNPHCFSQCEIIWEKEGEFFVSKNFYRAEGAHNPYRHKKHKWQQTSSTTGIMENYRLDLTRHEECDMMFTLYDNSWHGKLDSTKCLGERGNRIISEVHLYGDKLTSKDQGFDNKGNLVWGTPNLFHFVRH